MSKNKENEGSNLSQEENLRKNQEENLRKIKQLWAAGIDENDKDGENFRNTYSGWSLVVASGLQEHPEVLQKMQEKTHSEWAMIAGVEKIPETVKRVIFEKEIHGGYIFGELPPVLWKQEHIERIFAEDLGLDNLKGIGNLKKLRMLFVEKNPLNVFPLELVNALHLCVLDITDTNITVLPKDVNEWLDMDNLMIDDNKITLPEILEFGGHLKSLFAANCNLNEFPQGLENVNIDSLFIGENGFKELPTSHKGEVKYLHLERSQLESLTADQIVMFGSEVVATNGSQNLTISGDFSKIEKKKDFQFWADLTQEPNFEEVTKGEVKTLGVDWE